MLCFHPDSLATFELSLSITSEINNVKKGGAKGIILGVYTDNLLDKFELFEGFPAAAVDHELASRMLEYYAEAER